MVQMTSRLLLPALLTGLLATSAAFGAPAPKGAPAGYEEKYKAVVAAEKSEEYEKALALLDEIPAEKQNVYTRLKRSSLLVRLGRFVEAEEMLSALQKDPKADAIRDVVRGDLEDLRARMPKLSVRTAKAKDSDLWVTLDGNHIGPPVTVPVNPGTHVVAATRGGVEVFRQKITIQDSQSIDVEIEPTPAPGPTIGNVSVPATPKPKPTDTDAHETASPGLRRAAPAFAVGVLFVGGAVASFAIMSAAQTNLEANCAAQPRHGCDTDAAGAGRVRTWETLGWVSTGLAVASVGVGVTLWLSAPSAAEKRTVSLSPAIGGGFAGLNFQGSF